MSSDQLKAIVIGAGWAGEGHTIALRKAGVEVVAMCGRTPEPARAMAAKLNIADVRFDWRQAIEDMSPDIVSIATPGATHEEMAVYAAQSGCHIICEKPMGLDAGAARAMLAAAERAGVKHAYTASSPYSPEIVLASQAFRSGLIGELAEIESIINFDFPQLTPYSWLHRLDLGGGLLNNAFTHVLAQVTQVTGGTVKAIAGELRCQIDRAPVGEPVHDFRNVFGASVAVDETTEWRAADADTAYSVLAQIAMPDTREIIALFKSSLFTTGRNPSYLAFYGKEGTLHVTGGVLPTAIVHYDKGSGEWKDLADGGPDAELSSEDGVQHNWNRLVGEFVGDLQGMEGTRYPTFKDGWTHNEIIDIVRSSRGWTPVPTSPLPVP